MRETCGFSHVLRNCIGVCYRITQHTCRQHGVSSGYRVFLPGTVCSHGWLQPSLHGCTCGVSQAGIPLADASHTNVNFYK